MQGINNSVFIHVKVKGVVGIGGIVGMAVLRFVPADDLTDILEQGLAFCNV